MSRIHRAVDRLIGAYAKIVPAGPLPAEPGAIFCLRNNDLGDTLVTTPLYEALKRRFPRARVIAGVGPWAVDLIRGNPFVDNIAPVSAPWHNKFSAGEVFYGSRKGLLRSFRYLACSPELRPLRRARIDIGIDVLGSAEGAALLLRLGIPYRVGVNGYSGGHEVMQATQRFSDQVYVGRFALGFAELLGLPAEQLPAPTPQLYLSAEELAAGRDAWGDSPRRRLVVGMGTGGGADRRWPSERYHALMRAVSEQGRWDVRFLGGKADQEEAEALAERFGGASLAGRLSLRQTASMIAASDHVLCSPSMMMHLSAAFSRPTTVLLGPAYPSAAHEARLWNCNPHAVVLGPENDGRLATVDEVMARLG